MTRLSTRSIAAASEFEGKGTPASADSPTLSPAAFTFERLAAAQHWRRSTEDIALLLTRVPFRVKQYDGDVADWVFRPRTDDRLFRQIEKLLSFPEEDTSSRHQVRRLEEHRLGPGFTFVKFLEGHGRRGLGYYLPTELVRELLKNPDVGPSGGRVHYIKQSRYLDPRTFVKLVQDSWIGSIGSTTELLSRIVGLIPSEQLKNRVLAVDEPLADSNAHLRP